MTLAISGLTVQLLVVGFLVICVLMVLTVLIQRPQGGGLSGAFGAGGGGGNAGQTAFGARTGDALTIATIAIFVIYLVTAVGLVFAARNFAAPPQQPAMSAGPETGAETQDLVELGIQRTDEAADQDGGEDGLTITPVENAEDVGADEGGEGDEAGGDEPVADEPATGDGG